MSKTSKFLWGTLLVSSSLCSVEQALAAAPTNTVEVVVVTASKRTEKLLEVPSSVSAVSDALLNRVQANNIGDIAAYVPGLNVVAEGVSANRLVIRGLSTGPQDLSPTVGVYVDEAPFGSNTGFALGALFSPDLDPSDLDRIEVLRGPQGTLYGASTLGGLVKYVTKAPDLEEFGAHVRADVGTDSDAGTWNESIRVGFNAPIIKDVVALRVTGFYSNADGAITNVRTGQTGLNGNRKLGGRADLKIQPTNDLSVDLVAMYDNSNTPHLGVVTGNIATLMPTYGQYKGYDYVDGHARSNYAIYQANIHYNLGDGYSLTSSSSYSRFAVNELADDTTTFQPAFGGFLGPLFEFAGPVSPTDKKFTQEIRLASPSHEESGDSLEWLVGVYYDHEQSLYHSGVNSTYLFGATPPAFLAATVAALANYETVDLRDRYIETAGFANATYYFSPEFDVSAGLRYSTDSQRSLATATGFLVNIAVLPASQPGQSSDSVLTESFDARWHFDENVMAYVRVARGFRPGGPALLSSFQPDSTWNYEGGVKGSFFDGTVTGAVDAFYIDWTNIQLNFFNGTNTITGNAGNALSEGLELEGTYVPFSGLTLSLNADYTDAHMTFVKPGATGGAAVGDQLPFSSKFAAALRGDYVFPLCPDVDGNVGAGLRFKSGFNTTFPGDTGARFFKLPSTTFVDLRGGVSIDSNYSINLQILNLFDEHKLTDIAEYTAVSHAAADAFGEPVDLAFTPGRVFGLSLTAQY